MTMKFLSKYAIFSLLLLSLLNLTSCLEEEEGLYDKVGPVATIPAVIVVAKLDPATKDPILDPATKQPITSPVRAGDLIRLSVRFYSPNVAVKELILSETVATSAKQQVTSRPITNFDTKNSYVETFDYQVPAGTAGRRIVLEVAAVTDNDLTNTRTLTLNIPQQ
jgi:hypothetical protein